MRVEDAPDALDEGGGDGCCSVVPPLAADTCQVWLAPVSSPAPSLAVLLDDTERRRWQRHIDDRARDAFLVGHALLRLVVGAHTGTPARAVRFATACRRCGGDHGKPTVLGADAVQVSLSHCNGLVAVAVAQRHPVGVDVEQVTPRVAGIVEPALTAAEHAVLRTLPADRQADAATRYWVRKEAVLKATGDGLAVEPRRLTVSPPSQAPRLLEWAVSGDPYPDVHLADVPAPPGYRASVSFLGTRLAVTRHDGAAVVEGDTGGFR